MDPKYLVYQDGVISTGFYDGATEGFVCRSGRRPVYFELVAWDSDQDDRLFAVESVEESILDELVSMLGPRPSEKLWIVNWDFDDDEYKERAEELLQICKTGLLDTSTLALGPNITDALLNEATLDETERQQLRNVLRSSEPDDLAAWRGRYQLC